MGRPLQGEEDKLFLPSPTLYIYHKFLFTESILKHIQFLPKVFTKNFPFLACLKAELFYNICS